MKIDNKSHLILLHGALGTSAQFDFIVPRLSEYFEVHRLNFEGHGETGSSSSPFRMSYFAENVLGYMDEHGIKTANFFGYSMGGYVALILAKNHPEKVKKVATLGTILQWNETVADRECRYLHPKKIKEKVPHFAEQLAERHLSGWEHVVNNTRDMLQNLGAHPEIKADEWKHINCPLRFHVGDRDTTAGVIETVDIYKKTEKSELVVLPKTGHPIIEADKDLLVLSLEKFFREINKPDIDDRAQKKNGSRN
ncbi:MAG: alpha/beta fold hydrolase [Bacteroidota bacterium]